MIHGFKNVLNSIIFVLIVCSTTNCQRFGNFCWLGNIIPYNMTSQYIDAFQMREIEKAVDLFNKHTCLRWVRIEGAPIQYRHFVQFTKILYTDGCQIKINEPNEDKLAVLIELTDTCFNKRLLVQSMMLALGFPLELQRPDRDCYVEFLKPPPENSVVFQISQNIEPWLLRYPYDTDSVMQSIDSEMMRPKVIGMISIAHNGPVFVQDPTKIYRGNWSFTNPGNQLSKMDISKVLYKYCGKPHFCHSYKSACESAKEDCKFDEK